MKKSIIVIVILILILSVTIFACNKAEYMISFETNGGTNVPSIATDGKSTIKLPTAPKKENYIFDGWFYDNHFFRKPFDSNSLKKQPIDKNITVYARWKRRLTNSQGLKYELINNVYTIVGYEGVSEHVMIGSKYNDRQIRSIAPKAFKDSNIKSIVIADAIEEIGEGAFMGCNKIVEMTLPFIGKNRTVSQEASSVFGHIFGSAETFSLLPPLTTEQYFAEGKSLFYYIPSSLKKITISSDMRLPYGAFSNLKNVERIVINSPIESIGEKAFYDCKRLQSFYISKSVKEISAQAFNKCTNLIIYCQSESKPSTWNTQWKQENTIVYWDICEQDFGYYLGIYYIIKDDKIFITSYKSENQDIEVPNSIYGLYIKGIYKRAFSNLESMISLAIPRNIELIEREIIYNCSQLQSINLPFVGRAINEKVENYFGYIFGASVSTMNEDYVPSTIRYVSVNGGQIHKSSFNNCRQIETVKLPNVKEIGESAFKDCINIVTIKELESIKRIGNTAFLGCKKLEDIDLSLGDIEEIGERAFENCESLESIKLSNNIVALRDSLFANCKKLKSITIPSKLKTISNKVFFNCININELVLPKKLEHIGEEAFAQCIGLTEIIIPDSVRYIGVQAFADCINLVQIFIPKGVITIDQQAFSGCTKLTIYCQAETEPIDYKESWHGNRPIEWGVQL